VKAIPYGCPLFALLQKEKLLTKEQEKSILKRLLLAEKGDWKESLPSCFSILGTCMQMGQVYFHLASTVVARGYACLTHLSADNFDGHVADIRFFTDPVCSRLAMSMMLDGVQLVDDDKGKSGKHPSFWMKKATDIFSHGMCCPHRGDIGEVVCSLYLLFCGDLIRHNINAELAQFSVPLATWISLLRDPKLCVKEKDEDPNVSVNFIQVCRNYLRHSL